MALTGGRDAEIQPEEDLEGQVLEGLVAPTGGRDASSHLVKISRVKPLGARAQTLEESRCARRNCEALMVGYSFFCTGFQVSYVWYLVMAVVAGGRSRVRLACGVCACLRGCAEAGRQSAEGVRDHARTAAPGLRA